MFQSTNVLSYQCFELPMFRATIISSYHATEQPCNKSKNREARNKVQEPKNEKQSARTEVQEPKCENRSARTEVREPRSENQSAKTKVQEPKNKILGAKSLEQNPRSKKPQFFTSLAVKLTRNPTFGILFCFAVKGKQVVLLLVHGFAALTKVFCRLLTHRSGQKPLFAEGKIVSEDRVDQVILVRPSSESGCRQPKYFNTINPTIQKTKNISPYDYR